MELLLKVSAHSRTASVAGAIAGVVRDHDRAELLAIGAGAVNKAVKAMALATQYLEADGIFVANVPVFERVTLGDRVGTAIKFIIEPKQ